MSNPIPDHESLPAAVDTKQVVGRRTLHFDQIAEILADAEQITARPFDVLGNWSAGQILLHLARTIDASIDGAGFRVAFPIRWVGRLVLKRRMLTRPMSPGYRLPRSAASYLPGATETAAGLQALRAAIARLADTEQRKPHVIFGPLTKAQWDQLHCRHAEMHLSFIVPRTAS